MTDSINPNLLKISSEDQAWQILDKALSEELGDEFQGITFEGWPVVEVKLVGEMWSSSLTAQNMQGLIEIQKYLYQALSVLLYDNGNTNQLTAQQKEEITVSFKLSKSSSLIELNLDKVTDGIIKTLGPHMSPELIVITAISLALTVGGISTFRTWLQGRKEIHLAKLAEESRQFAAEQETKRMEIFARAVKREPKLGQLQDRSQDMYMNVVKGLSDADDVSIAGHSDIAGTTLQQMVKGPRVKSVEERLDGYYKIQRVDSSDPTAFRVRLLSVDNHEEFSAIVQNDFVYITSKNKEKLQQAEWERKEIYLKVNARRLNGVVTSALILAIPNATEAGGDIAKGTDDGESTQ
jgi:hypothetical protein